MRLTDFIREHHGEIIKEWVSFARTLPPGASGMNEQALRDHADQLLTAMVADMETSQTNFQKSEKSKGKALEGESSSLSRIGQKHARDRLESGFKLSQVVAEYRALRASVLRLWEQAHGEKQGEVTRFNETIDEALAESTNRYAEILNHTREQFLAILGHELRNPLSAIVMGANALTKSEKLDDKLTRVAIRILNSAERMTRLVSDLLDFARTRLGADIPLTAARMDLVPACRQLIGELEAVHPDCQVYFESTGDLVGEWDSDRLVQAISNLIANALQYGCESGAVRVGAEQQGDEVVLHVHNEGPPISESYLKTIFEPMVRQPESRDKNSAGLGLGLYIANEIVTAHGGTIGVTSTEKEGTTFTVRIPRRSPPPPQGTSDEIRW